MDTTMHLMAREVQRAVNTAPTTTLVDAVETARRARRSLSERIGSLAGQTAQRTAAGI